MISGKRRPVIVRVFTPLDPAEGLDEFTEFEMDPDAVKFSTHETSDRGSTLHISGPYSWLRHRNPEDWDPGWVSVEERLPDEGLLVDAWAERRGRLPGVTWFGRFGWSSGGFPLVTADLTPITHWRPLPKGPKT